MRKLILDSMCAVVVLGLLLFMFVSALISISDSPFRFARRDYGTLAVFQPVSTAPPGSEAVLISGHDTSSRGRQPAALSSPRGARAAASAWAKKP
jgi:hypothetical protein